MATHEFYIEPNAFQKYREFLKNFYHQNFTSLVEEKTGALNGILRKWRITVLNQSTNPLAEYGITKPGNTQKGTPLNLKVINAGLGRTGTMSIKTALNKLGYNTCHTINLVEQAVATGDDSIFHYWSLAFKFKNEGKVDLCKYILKEYCIDGKYDAVTDNPACNFYKELSEMFPEAKVLLSKRDRPEDWVKSYFNSSYLMHKTMLNWFYRKMLFILPFPSKYYDMTPYLFQHEGMQLEKVAYPACIHQQDKNYMQEMYVKHNSSVEKEISSENLLVYNTKQGWEPLCQKLDKPVPEEAFPRLNSSQKHGSGVNAMALMGNVVLGDFATAMILFYLKHLKFAVTLLILPFVLKIVFRNVIFPRFIADKMEDRQ